MERRLAAILATDVVGYSRLIRADEEGTIAALKTLRSDLIDPKIAEHHGRIVKLMGDGMLAEFPSVVDAVRAAVETQQAVAEHNASLPEDRWIEFRVGINLGDVVIDGDDIQGDGVNIAARLEGMAEPGGICISGKVYEEVRDRIDVPFEDLGEQAVKNIDRPVRVWRWLAGDGAALAGPIEATLPLPLPDKPSIAVLPFDNMSGDPDQEFFADGIAEDIITQLSKFRSLFVIARNSSFSFKGQALDIKEVGQKLGVRYVVEGSVRRAGNRVRITAQLIDAVADAHLWAEHYDRELDDIFAVQDEVTQAIVTAIEPTLGSAELERARRVPTGKLDAWEAFQRGLWHVFRYKRDDNAKAQEFFRRATEIDGGFAPAHAGLAYTLFLSVMLGFGDDPALSVAAAYEAAQRAVALDPDDAFCQMTIGRIHEMTGAHDAAISAYEKALALNPNDASAHYLMGWALVFSERPEEGLQYVDDAIRLSPRDPRLWGFLTSKGMAFIAMARFEEALAWCRKATAQPNAGVRAHFAEIVALVQLERIDEARQALDRVFAIKPDLDMNFVRNVAATMYPALAERYVDGLRKAGLEA